MGGLPTTKKGHDYLFMVVDKFNNMCVMILCKRPLVGKKQQTFFLQGWVHFGIPRSIILDRDTRFLNVLWTTLWEKRDMKLNISTTFHPQNDENIQQRFGTISKGIQLETPEDRG